MQLIFLGAFPQTLGGQLTSTHLLTSSTSKFHPFYHIIQLVHMLLNPIELHFQVLANKLANLAQEHPHMVLPKIDIPLEHPHSHSTNLHNQFPGHARVYKGIFSYTSNNQHIIKCKFIHSTIPTQNPLMGLLLLHN
jgi:hypothetical protein